MAPMPPTLGSAPAEPWRSSRAREIPAPTVGSPSASRRQALVHPVHVGAMEARHVVRRRQRLLVEERRQLVVFFGEAGAPVELGLELERLAPEFLEEVLREARPVRGV